MSPWTSPSIVSLFCDTIVIFSPMMVRSVPMTEAPVPAAALSKGEPA
jgi:hypothetical protein